MAAHERKKLSYIYAESQGPEMPQISEDSESDEKGGGSRGSRGSVEYDLGSRSDEESSGSGEK